MFEEVSSSLREGFISQKRSQIVRCFPQCTTTLPVLLIGLLRCVIKLNVCVLQNKVLVIII